MQETDLLAFQIAIQESNVGTVMCAYNQLNSVYTCEDPYLLTDVLKKSWNYQGWVMTDWGAAHSTVPSALAGLDQEMPSGRYFGDALKAAVEKGDVPVARLNDMVHRILRTEIALGVFDKPPVFRPVNPFTGAEVAQRSAEQGIVLLKNANGQLPLEASASNRLRSSASMPMSACFPARVPTRSLPRRQSRPVQPRDRVASFFPAEGQGPRARTRK